LYFMGRLHVLGMPGHMVKRMWRRKVHPAPAVQ
jgi:hypothetical protein